MPAPTVTQPLNFWQRILYGICFGVIYLISLLPLRVHYFFADVVLFPAVFHLTGYRRKIVWKNLTASFPEKGEAELREIERRFYHWFCDYIVETLKLFSMKENDVRRHMVFENCEEVQELMRQGKSTAVYLGHYCNWEWASSFYLNFKETDGMTAQVYHVLESPVMDHLMLYVRSRMGSANVSMSEVLRFIIKKQRDGQPFQLAFIADQTPTWNNIHLWLPFLGHPETPVFTGGERLIKRFDLPAFYCDLSRVKRGYYKGRYERLYLDTKDVPDYQITEKYFELMEKSIRRQPELWLWSHNRWKRTREEYDRMFGKEKGGQA